MGKSNGGFSEGGFSNNRFVLKPDVAITSEVSIFNKNSLTITDFHAKKTQHVQLFQNPLPGTPPIRDSQKRAPMLGSVLAEWIFKGFFVFGPPDFFAGFVAGFFSPR